MSSNAEKMNKAMDSIGIFMEKQELADNHMEDVKLRTKVGLNELLTQHYRQKAKYEEQCKLGTTAEIYYNKLIDNIQTTHKTINEHIKEAEILKNLIKEQENLERNLTIQQSERFKSVGNMYESFRNESDATYLEDKKKAINQENNELLCNINNAEEEKKEIEQFQTSDEWLNLNEVISTIDFDILQTKGKEFATNQENNISLKKYMTEKENVKN